MAVTVSAGFALYFLGGGEPALWLVIHGYVVASYVDLWKRRAEG